MGKKHSIAKPASGGRKNGIFKIAGANFKEKKGGRTPKEIVSKLKVVRNIKKIC